MGNSLEEHPPIAGDLEAQEWWGFIEADQVDTLT